MFFYFYDNLVIGSVSDTSFLKVDYPNELQIQRSHKGLNTVVTVRVLSSLFIVIFYVPIVLNFVHCAPMGEPMHNFCVGKCDVDANT